MKIEKIIILLLISIRLFRSQRILCFPPFNFIQDSICVRFCDDGYLVEQGTNFCKLNKNCPLPESLENVRQIGQIFCGKQGQSSRIINKETITSMQSCQGRVQNWITGLCETQEEIREQQLTEIGFYSFDKTAFFNLSLSHLLNIKGTQIKNLKQLTKQLFGQNCEVIDLNQKQCITKNACLKLNRNISNNNTYCSEICALNESSLNKFCLNLSPQGLNPSERYSNVMQLQKCNDYLNEKQICIYECKNSEIYFDFQTAMKYCNYKDGNYIYTNNKTNLITKFDPECGVGEPNLCFQFCLIEQYSAPIFKILKDKIGNRLTEKCQQNQNISFGLFMIDLKDCPHFILGQSCVKKCDSNMKVVQMRDIKQCVLCKRQTAGGNGCSDRCKINQKSSEDNTHCFESNTGSYSFEFNQQTKKFECNFPQMLSNDSKSCIDECSHDEVPIQQMGSRQFQCKDRHTILPQQIYDGYYLSSDQTRYVKNCSYIHEISCPQSSNKCQKKIIGTELNKSCQQTDKEALEWIDGEQKRLVDQYKGTHFMNEEIKWFLIKSTQDKLPFEEKLQILSNLTEVAIKFSLGYAKNLIDGGEQLIVGDDTNQISIKVAVLPDEGGLFQETINFDESFKPKSEIQIIKKEEIKIKALALTHFQGYTICTITEKQCSRTKFVIIQTNMHDEYDINERISFKIQFDLDKQYLQQDSRKERKYHCLVGNIKDGLKSLTKSSPLENNTPNKNSIICEGDSFVGLYYGNQDDQLESISEIIPNQSDQIPSNSSYLVIILLIIGVIFVVILSLVVFKRNIKSQQEKGSKNQQVKEGAKNKITKRTALRTRQISLN